MKIIKILLLCMLLVLPIAYAGVQQIEIPIIINYNLNNSRLAITLQNQTSVFDFSRGNNTNITEIIVPPFSILVNKEITINACQDFLANQSCKADLQDELFNIQSSINSSLDSLRIESSTAFENLTQCNIIRDKKESCELQLGNYRITNITLSSVEGLWRERVKVLEGYNNTLLILVGIMGMVLIVVAFVSRGLGVGWVKNWWLLRKPPAPRI